MLHTDPDEAENPIHRLPFLSTPDRDNIPLSGPFVGLIDAH